MSASRQKKAEAREKARARAKRRRDLNERKATQVAYAIPPGATETSFRGRPAIIDPPGVRRMSEVMLDFLKPYEDLWDSPETLRRLMSLAAVAWNSCLLPPSERDSFVRKTCELIPGEVLPLIAEMVVRKMTHFAQNDRYILDFTVSETAAGPHLSVVSTFAPPGG